MKKQLQSGLAPKGLKKRCFLALQLLFLCFVACMFIQIPQGYGENVKNESVGNMTIFLGENDNNREITMTAGETIQIGLEETGATGYKWHVAKLDQAYLGIISEETKAGTERKLGAPVMAYWKIRALKKGHTEILMLYYRSWEGPDKALSRYRLKVNIL